jgi:microcin C transport system substrate-binding protein
MRRIPWTLAAALLALALSGCGEPEQAIEYDRAAAMEALGIPGARSEDELDTRLAKLDQVRIDPPPVVGRDYAPVFPPLLPFDPKEWKTNPPPPSVADPRAKKGGKVNLGYTDWPPTIRTEGPNSRLAFLSDMHLMIYETLVGYSLEIQDFVPGLASHWRLLDDKMTMQFRIDEEARWADGREVTADDVAATVEHLLNPDRKDPLVNKYWDELIDYVKVLDKYTVEIKAKQARWRSMMTIGWGMQIYPAAYMRMDGETYLDEWNWKLPPGTGPYEVRPADIKKGRSITMHRRKDYWAKDRPEARGAYNFDEIVWHIVRDQELMYQKMLAGELDMYQVGRASRWVDELDREPAIAKGWIQRRKIFFKEPQGYGGFCFNLRQPPFDSRDVRLAFAHLFNREKLFAKILFNQYEYIDSYFPGQIWARPDAQRIRFDPKTALQLLAKEGYVDRDAQGYLVKADGTRFPELTLEFAAPGFVRIFKVVVDDLWDKAGIKMELKLIDSATLLKKVWDYQFNLVFWSWTANLFPEPIQQFHSMYADPKQTNNLNGLKNPEVDRIVTEYQTEFDPHKRLEMMHRLDEILFGEHIYALGWYAPFFRVLYWDRFGHPPEYTSRYTRDWINVMAYWWYDPDKDQQLAEAKRANRPLYPDKPKHQYDDIELTYWNDHETPMPDPEPVR